MGIPRAHRHLPSPPSLLSFLKLSCAILSLLSSLSLPATASGNLYALIYKGCANQTFYGDGAASSQAISTLSSSLTAQAASTNFYKTTVTSPYGGQAIFGLFQCRGDLSRSDCSSCVGRIIPMWSSLCGFAVAARVQVTGCYALYQVSGFPQVSGTQLLYKNCGSGGGGGGFEQRRDTAFSQLEKGIASSQGFYATSYSSVYAMAQCEGDLSASDCTECVNQAVQRSEVECGGSASGQVYLDKCYISYSYYRDGVPQGGSSSGGGGGGHGGGSNTAKTVAIVLGGAVGLGFLVICLLFARSLTKKKDEW